MDPISMLVLALATGAAAGLQSTAEDTVKTAYTGLKDLIHRKFGHTAEVALLEGDPASKARQEVVKEVLAKTDAGTDEEVLRQAQVVLDAIRKAAPEAAQIVGVSLKDVEAGATLNIKDIISSGSGVIAERVKAGQNINIEGVHTGVTGGTAGDEAHPTNRQ